MHVRRNLQALRVAVPYIRAYKNRVFVVKLGGQLCQPGRTLDNLVDQLGLLYQLGIKLIVVHGGATQANALSARLGLTPSLVAGRRITDAATLEVVKMAFAGTVNTDLLAAFRRVEVPAIGLCGVDAGLVSAKRRPPTRMTDPSGGEQEIDFGHVGDVVRINAEVIHRLLNDALIPVLCPLAADDQGNILNVNADTVAAHIAVATGAAKYFLVTNVDGVMRAGDDPSTLISQLELQQLDELIESGVVSGGMLPKLAACVHALEGGVPRVHIVNGQTPDTLLGEVFTNEGCGTLLVESSPAVDQGSDVGGPVT
ncbi:MAG: acetylglutamate kinase [bacterium]|nr:acetylglutamate kinase [bacterium]